MKEYVEREAILNEQTEVYYWDGLNNNYGDFVSVEAIHSIPAADVEPVRHGEWREEFRSQKSPDGYFYWNTPQKKIYVCSICGREEIKKEPYCNCGAKMDRGNKK